MKLLLKSLSLITLFVLTGCACKKKNTPLKPNATLGTNNKNKTKAKEQKEECKSCTKTYKNANNKKRHAFLKLEEADILL